MYLVGSRSLEYTLAWKRDKEPDWDFVLEDEDIQPSKEMKVDIGPNDLMSLEVCQYYDMGDTVETPVGEAKLVHPLAVMLMKRSHLHRPVRFAKHIVDYHELKNLLFGDTDTAYFTLLAERTKLTKEKYKDRKPSLKKAHKEFFTDTVTRIYNHDDLHYATAFGDRPLFEKLKDSDTVWCSKKKWENLPHKDKINCVREESMVLGLERFIIPKLSRNETHMSGRFSFLAATEKICTTTCSGWFRDFAIENWPEIIDFDYDFLGKFQKWAEEHDNAA